MSTNAIDTKTKIFFAALRLFATDGYDKVSVRSLSDAVGIKVASLYNHYEHKDQILATCYDFYLRHRYQTRLTREQYEPILIHGTQKKVMDSINYSFPEEITLDMIYALLIIYSRIYTDPRAKEIYASEISGAMAYLEEFFNVGIKVGRFHPFNISTVSLIIISTRLFSAQSVTIAPEDKHQWRGAEHDFFNELVRIIPFKY